jgi:hypothetical protein
MILHLEAQQCPANLTHMSVVCPNTVCINMCIYTQTHMDDSCVRKNICRDIIYVHAYMCICIHEHKYVRLSINRFIFLSLYVCIYIYIYIQIYTYTHVLCLWMCASESLRAHARIREIWKRRNKTKWEGGNCKNTTKRVPSMHRW